MVIFHNVDSTQEMKLSINSVEWLIENAQNLTILGNLRSWRGIDYYDSNSPLFYKSESLLSQLKLKIKSRNWDLDLDCENLDHLYS